MIEESAKRLHQFFEFEVRLPPGRGGRLHVGVPEQVQDHHLADLARHDGLVLGTDLEFTDRPEWPSLRDAYGLSDYDAGVLTATRPVADYFEAVREHLTGKGLEVTQEALGARPGSISGYFSAAEQVGFDVEVVQRPTDDVPE